MAGYKETPRQKMIAMMYLVLTALLALNVSKEILDAFLIVNKSMESTNESVTAKVKDKYAQFENQYTMSSNKVGPYWERAKNVRTEAINLIKYLEYIKYKLVQVNEKKDSLEIMNLYYVDTTINNVTKKVLDLGEVPTKDKYNETTNYLVRENKKGEAYNMAKRMKVYRDTVLNVMNLPWNSTKVGLITNMEGHSYSNSGGVKQDWEQYNFYHTILAADITIINKIISEVRSAEFNALNYLYASVSEKDFKFDSIKAEIIPRSTYVFQGQDYVAEVLVAAYDSRTELKSLVVQGASELNDNNQKSAKTIIGKNGTIGLIFPTNSEGEKQYAGIIEMRNPATGEIDEFKYSGKYYVAPPSLTVAPLKMNVLYIDVDNPVSISAAGLPRDQIVPSISIGKLTKNGDEWTVRIDAMPNGERITKISATAMIDDERLFLGEQIFRIKNVPPPIAQVAGLTDGEIGKNTLLASNAIIPDQGDFMFELRWDIVSYTFRSTNKNGDWITEPVKGNIFTDRVKKHIRSGNRGQIILFDRIKAKGPGGRTVSLSPVTLELK